MDRKHIECIITHGVIIVGYFVSFFQEGRAWKFNILSLQHYNTILDIQVNDTIFKTLPKYRKNVLYTYRPGYSKVDVEKIFLCSIEKKKLSTNIIMCIQYTLYTIHYTNVITFEFLQTDNVI